MTIQTPPDLVRLLDQHDAPLVAAMTDALAAHGGAYAAMTLTQRHTICQAIYRAVRDDLAGSAPIEPYLQRVATVRAQTPGYNVTSFAQAWELLTTTLDGLVEQSYNMAAPDGLAAQLALGDTLRRGGLAFYHQYSLEREQTLHHAHSAEQQAATTALADREAQLERMTANIPGMVYQFVLAPDGHMSFPFVSAGAEVIFGLPRETIMADANHVIVMILPEHQETFQQSVAHSAATLTIWRWQGQFRTADGHEKWLDGTSRPVARPDGSICWDGILLDITTLKQIEAEQARFRALAETTPDLIGMATLDGRPIYLNPAWRALAGLAPDAPIDQRAIRDFHPAWVQQLLAETGIPTAIQHGQWQGESAVLEPNGAERPVSQVILCHTDAQGRPFFLSTIARDLTRQKQAEATERALQEELLRVQSTALAELSTPLIALTAETMLMPLIGAVDTGRASQIMETLLQGVAQHGAQVAILDLTGVPVVDTQVAAALIQAAQATQLLGARVFLTGIRPEIAQTLVTLGVDLSAVTTYGDLQQGITEAFRRYNPQTSR